MFFWVNQSSSLGANLCLVSVAFLKLLKFKFILKINFYDMGKITEGTGIGKGGRENPELMELNDGVIK